MLNYNPLSCLPLHSPAKFLSAECKASAHAFLSQLRALIKLLFYYCERRLVVDVDVNVDYNDGRVSQLLHYSYVVRYSTQLDSTRFDLGRYLYPFDILRSNGQIKCSL